LIEFRCTKCILPNTFPKIEFNKNGYCIYCQKGLGIPKKKLNVLPNGILSKSKIIIGVSGGRDSTYGLLYLRKLKKEIIAFTYDWPLVNQLARNNVSRLVSHFSVEHVVRAPETQKHLKYIRSIVNAIEKKPDARAIPLLLAPDKYFFYEAQRLGSKYLDSAIIFCSGNELEFTDFKSRILGTNVPQSENILRNNLYDILKMFIETIKMYFYNPRLLKAGLKIPIVSFYITYIYKRNIYYLYDYIDWDEHRIQDKLKLLWKGPDGAGSNKKWRSGDGSAEFYNFLYRSLFGFDERTCFLSNQIRAGLITRTKALSLENQSIPDFELLQEYAKIVGFSLDQFIMNWNKKINIDYFLK
jgi:glucosamine--fructose-6-phosphate aminotransferase (isomerizing)